MPFGTLNEWVKHIRLNLIQLNAICMGWEWIRGDLHVQLAIGSSVSFRNV